MSDRIDTRERSIDNILIGLKNLMNQQYAEDISKKIGTVKRFRRSRGELVGSMTPYGYRRNPDDWKHLVVNEESQPERDRSNETVYRFVNKMGPIGSENHFRWDIF